MLIHPEGYANFDCHTLRTGARQAIYNSQTQHGDLRSLAIHFDLVVQDRCWVHIVIARFFVVDAVMGYTP